MLLESSTVFVSRRTTGTAKYWDRGSGGGILDQADVPTPIYVSYVDVLRGVVSDELVIEDSDPLDTADELTFINDGYKIVDNATGRIYQVLERLKPPDDKIISLYSPWLGAPAPAISTVWVIPPPAGGGRNPCIAVYQKVIRF